MKILTFKANEFGRDFICADIHGHFTLLEKQLNEVRFDTLCDRLFSLGDMIDRGEESHLVIEYLSKPWFKAILGNHELMLIDAVEGQSESIRNQWMFWGGDWAEDFDDNTLQKYYQAIVELPMAIKLNLSDGKTVGLVHAELPECCDWKEVEGMLLTKDKRDNHTNTPLTNCMLWSRSLIQEYDSLHTHVRPIENIDHVFHGHTILNAITSIANRTYLDLGSYRTGQIGLINPLEFVNKKK